MPRPKHMLVMVGLAAATYIALRRYEAKSGSPTASRWGA